MTGYGYIEFCCIKCFTKNFWNKKKDYSLISWNVLAVMIAVSALFRMWMATFVSRSTLYALTALSDIAIAYAIYKKSYLALGLVTVTSAYVLNSSRANSATMLFTVLIILLTVPIWVKKFKK